MTSPAGSSQATFLALLERHLPILQKVSRAYCPFAAQRPDLVAEMTAALWRSFERYDPSRPFGTWAYRIVLNVAISFFRSESRRVERLAPLDGLERYGDRSSADPRVGSLLDCIEDLGPFDKALVLMHLDGYSHAEAGGVLGITPSNAATKLARIKVRLRTAMTADGKGAQQ